MKKILLTLTAALGLAGAANSAVLLNESFSYSDGNLTTVSSGAWSAHSGAGNGPVQVIGNKIQLVTTAAEDVNRSIGVSYSNQNLYASFKMNLTVLPSATTYFAHFLQNATTFRCRVWAITNGAAPGKYRLGITSVGSTTSQVVAVPSDLDPNTDYTVVLRFLGGTNATLWVNPTSESSIANRADGTNDITALGSWASTAFAFRQSTGMGTMTIDDLLVGDQFSDVATIGGPPSISGLVSTNIPANTSTGPMPFIVNDVETAATNLVVTATSDNPTLVPNNPANLTFGGSGENRTLTVTPATGQQGVAIIEVVVTDLQGDKATNTFTLTVGQPAISAIANQIAYVGAITNVAFWVNDTETAPGSLTVTATSDNQTVLPDANIGIVNSGGTNRTIWLTNTAAGFAVVTVTLNDGTFNVPTTFTLTAAPDNGILLAEDFSYPDGSLITNSAFLWNAHSGTTGQTEVVNGKLPISFSRTEDVNRWFTNAPVASTSGQLIFTRFVVNFTNLPTASGVGEYFQHLYAFSGAFRARVFSTTNGAPAGKLRLGVSNGGFVTAVHPQVLDLNKDHVVITRYNTATAETTLWVDPVAESSPNVFAPDLTSTATIYGVAFRQNTGIGNLIVDDLLVGSTFNQVLLTLAPSPIPLNIANVGGQAVITWNDPGGQFKLATGTDIFSVTNIISGATSPYTNNLGDAQRYFRLVYP
ncbi:MAG: hypothetical protein ACK45B_15510 [Limisphaerales bacterium]